MNVSRWRVERALGLTFGFGPGWLSIAPNGAGRLHATWEGAMAFVVGQIAPRAEARA